MRAMLLKFLTFYWGGALLSAALFALVMTSGIYVLKGLPALSSEVFAALFELFRWLAQAALILSATLMLPISFAYLRKSSRFNVQLNVDASRLDDGVDHYAIATRMWLIFSLFFAMIAALIISALSFVYMGNAFHWLNIFSMFVVLSLAATLALVGVLKRCSSVTLVVLSSKE